MNNITTHVTNLPCQWKWKTQRNQFLSPKEMETTHLFYTIKMIWNHFMPTEFQIIPFKRYSYFSKFYTPSYLEEAISNIGKELLSRPDILPEHKAQLEFMASCLRNNKYLTQKQILLGN